MNQTIKLAGIGLLGAGIGFVVGYKVLEKKLEKAFDERLVAETEGMREFYTKARQPYASPEEAVADLIKPPKNKDPRTNGNKVQYNKVVPHTEIKPENVVMPTAPPVVQNVFETDGPVLITQDAFMANDPEHEQATLTYYEGSDQLCGEKDEPIDNEKIVTGTEYKTKFGWESSDENTVHVRNDALHMDFEIVRSEGSYEEEVLGQQVDTSIPPHERVRREGR